MSISAPAKNIEEYPAMLSGTEVAEIMRLSRPTAYKLIKDAEVNGWFPVFRVGSSQKIRVSKAALLRWMNGFTDAEELM